MDIRTIRNSLRVASTRRVSPRKGLARIERGVTMTPVDPYERLSLHGRGIVVTGAGSGIGRATAELLAARGARILAADVNGGRAEETAEIIRSRSGECIAYRADVRKEEDVANMVRDCVARFGRLDGAVNNAGIGQFGEEITDVDMARARRRIDVNLIGVIHCLKHEIRAMSEGASIVNMSSMTGLIGMSGLPAYSATKAAVIGLTRAVAADVASRGIRINAVAPGVVETDAIVRQLGAKLADAGARQPAGRLGAPGEVAEAVSWLLSDASSFVNGQNVVCDGGYTALDPGMTVDRR